MTAPQDKTPSKTEIITPGEAKFWDEWAAKTPALLRAQNEEIPDKLKERPNPFRMTGLGVGAVLGILSFTKLVPGKWKWVSAAGAFGAASAGLYLGAKTDMVQDAFEQSLPMVKKSIGEYADALDRDANLRQALAGYLSSNISAADIQSRGIEAAVIDRAVEFARATPYMDTDRMGDTIRCRIQGGSCGLSR
jgi:hypothetical protein